MGVRSSTGEAWERFTLPDYQGGGCWWFCARVDGSEDFFVESAPAPWTQYQDLSGGLYWHNGVTEEFFDTIEAVAPQPLAAEPAAQQPATSPPAAQPPASQQPAAQPPAAHQEEGPKEGPKQ